ncbi:MAG: hypothetical protein RI985_2274, partial [Chloroflexota bacterium]
MSQSARRLVTTRALIVYTDFLRFSYTTLYTNSLPYI